jgi:hypothetical protein
MQTPRPVEPVEQVDPDTVRLQRSADFDFTGSYRVLSGSKAAPVLVGVLVPEQGLRAGPSGMLDTLDARLAQARGGSGTSWPCPWCGQSLNRPWGVQPDPIRR